MKSRQEAIRRVLNEAEKPIGPTEIARRVNEGVVLVELEAG